MTEIKFEARVKATGLRAKPEDLAMLEALVKDLDRAASMLRGPRSYAEEPLNAFRLKQVLSSAAEGDAQSSPVAPGIN